MKRVFCFSSSPNFYISKSDFVNQKLLYNVTVLTSYSKFDPVINLTWLTGLFMIYVCIIFSYKLKVFDLLS